MCYVILLDRCVGAGKFEESECEKVDRLCELFFRYSDKLSALDARCATNPLRLQPPNHRRKHARGAGRYKAADEARAADPRWAAASAEDRAAVEAEEKEERYLERLEAGLYTLQLLAALLASIWGAEGPRARALMLLHQQSVELGAVRAVLDEYATSVGETAKEEGADADGAAAKEKREGAAAEAESIRALASFLVVGD
eukprot:COSAG04_NODE_5790_length_1493_cov_1.510760_1_plen_199_part_00